MQRRKLDFPILQLERLSELIVFQHVLHSLKVIENVLCHLGGVINEDAVASVLLLTHLDFLVDLDLVNYLLA